MVRPHKAEKFKPWTEYFPEWRRRREELGEDFCSIIAGTSADLVCVICPDCARPAVTVDQALYFACRHEVKHGVP